MKKETFDILMDNLYNRIASCAVMLPDDDFAIELLSLQRARNLKHFVHKELEIMDRIVMVDLYHVIGMGNLSPQQMMKFIYTMQNYLSYRPILKTIEANGFADLENLPKIPAGTKFTLLKLAPITLHTGSKDAAEETEDFFGDLTEEILTDTAEPPYSLDTKKFLVIRKDHLEDFWGDMGCTGNLDTLDKKIKGHNSYMGVHWSGYVDGAATGTVTTANVYLKLRKVLKEKYKVD